MLKRTVAVSMMMLASSGNAQVPPPPSLPGQDVLAEQLVRAVEGKDVPAYTALLAADVVVTEDDRVVAQSRAGWLDIYGKKLAARGVSFKLSPGFSSTGRLLFIEYFNSAGSWGGEVPAHCCWSYDAVAYDVADGKVTAIRRLRGGNLRLDERGRPVR